MGAGAGSSTECGNNQSAIAISKNGVISKLTEHVDVKNHFVTDTVESWQVRLQ